MSCRKSGIHVRLGQQLILILFVVTPLSSGDLCPPSSRHPTPSSSKILGIVLLERIIDFSFDYFHLEREKGPTSAEVEAAEKDEG